MGVLVSWWGLFSKEPEPAPAAYAVGPDRRAAHQVWVESDRATGERLMLCGDLSWRDLRGLDLSRADLRGVNFRSANLAGADLTGADVTGATFWDADLTDANLTDVVGLRAPSDGTAHPLGGANLAGAALPEEAGKFGALDNVAELCRSAGKLFVTLITADAFMQIIVAKTTDIQLLTGTGTATIPLLDADIPTAMLFWLGPLVLLILYVSFLLYLQRLWEMMAGLPAIFPDGMPLTQKSYPWLLTDMVRNEFRVLKKQKQPLSDAQYWLFAFLVYLLVPLTLFPFWARYLCRHDWVVTGIQIGYAGLFLFTLLTFFRLARRTLRRSARRLPPPPSVQPPCAQQPAPPQPSSPREPPQDRAVLIPSALIGAGWSGVVLLLSLYTIQWGLPPVLYRLGASSVGPIGAMDPGDYHWIIARPDLPVFAPARWVPRVLDEMGYHSFASVDEAELAVKPDGWLDTFTDDVNKVRQPARLRNVDLRYANLNRAFLVKADLRGAHLGYANLEYADLRSSDLRKAWFPSTDLYAVHLQLAHLDGASLRGATLQMALLEGTDLEGADLTGAKMTGACLVRAHLDGAILAGADLTGANLTSAVWDRWTVWPDGKTGPTDVFLRQHRHMVFTGDSEPAPQYFPSPPSRPGATAKAP